MNIARIRHRAANLFLRLTGNIAHPIARFICGPLNPEELYVEEPLKEGKIHRAAPRKSARPDVTNPRTGQYVQPNEKSKLADVEDNDDFVAYLSQREAPCER